MQKYILIAIVCLILGGCWGGQYNQPVGPIVTENKQEIYDASKQLGNIYFDLGYFSELWNAAWAKS